MSRDDSHRFDQNGQDPLAAHSSGESLSLSHFIQQNWLYALLLLAYATFIWFRDTVWISTSDDTLPILVAIPLFFWVESPWKFRKDPKPYSIPLFIAATLLFLSGVALNITLLLTISWCLLFWNWLATHVGEEMLPNLKKLMILPLMAFPWIALDADRLGWWFRLSGAWVTEHFFSLVGSDVTREGTFLVVNEVPISVEVACAGLNTLQSMLIAGSVVCYLILGNTKKYWINLPLLVVISWIANTLRIILITAAAVWISTKFAKGNFHVLGGWMVILFMFLLSWFIFSVQEEPETRSGEGSQEGKK